MAGMAIRKWCVKLAVGPPVASPMGAIVNAGPRWAQLAPAHRGPRLQHLMPAACTPPIAHAAHAVGRAPDRVARHDRALVWFRRDLRDFDHAALYHALRRRARRLLRVRLRSRDPRRAAVAGRPARRVHPGQRARARRGAARARRRADRPPRASPATRSRALAARARRRTPSTPTTTTSRAARDRDAAVAQALAARGIAFRDARRTR